MFRFFLNQGFHTTFYSEIHHERVTVGYKYISGPALTKFEWLFNDGCRAGSIEMRLMTPQKVGRVISDKSGASWAVVGWFERGGTVKFARREHKNKHRKNRNAVALL